MSFFQLFTKSTKICPYSLPSELNGLDVGLSVGGSGERRSGVTPVDPEGTNLLGVWNVSILLRLYSFSFISETSAEALTQAESPLGVRADAIATGANPCYASQIGRAHV